MADPTALLLSIRPRHADAIITGLKTVEVRRRRVSAPAGMTVILYATAPVKAIVATARLRESFVCSADVAWGRFSTVLGLAREELDAYLGGGHGCLLVLTDVVRLKSPLSLGELRSTQPFRPPQSYRFVRRHDPRALTRLQDGQRPRRQSVARRLGGAVA